MLPISLTRERKWVREKESVCVRERERERERKCVCERERERNKQLGVTLHLAGFGLFRGAGRPVSLCF